MKRRVAIGLSGFFMAVFLLVYFLINSATPNNSDQKPNFMLLQNQMDELEKDFRMHGSRMQNLIRQLQRAHNSNLEEEESRMMGGMRPATLSSFPSSTSSFKFNSTPVMRSSRECRSRFQQLPRPDIQVRKKRKETF